MKPKTETGKDKRLAGSVTEALGMIIGIDALQKRGLKQKKAGKREEALKSQPQTAGKHVKKPAKE